MDDDTGNAKKLPLMERARLGLLPSKQSLPVREIMRLEFPTADTWEERQRLKYRAWEKSIETAFRYGGLVPQLQVEDDWYLPGVDWITRENYQTWRLTQPNPPAGSIIHLWLSATPAVKIIPPEPTTTPATETLPPIETPLPELTTRAARPKPVGKSEKRRRDDVLTLAIRVAIAVLSPSGGALPRPPELFDYLLQNSGKGNKFPDLTANGKSLLWTADNGSRKNTDATAITERLRRWKG